jgi:hypothetical protein
VTQLETEDGAVREPAQTFSYHKSNPPAADDDHGEVSGVEPPVALEATITTSPTPIALYAEAMHADQAGPAVEASVVVQQLPPPTWKHMYKYKSKRISYTHSKLCKRPLCLIVLSLRQEI